MGVLKRSSAAMIVLLLFLASLPGAKSVQHENEQSSGGFLRRIRNVFHSPPDEKPVVSVCGISSPDPEDVKFLGSGGTEKSSMPPAGWVTRQITRALQNESKDALINNRNRLKVWGRYWLTGLRCTRKKSLNEIARMAGEIIEQTSNNHKRIDEKFFRKVVNFGLFQSSFKEKMRRARCWIAKRIFFRFEGACRDVKGLQEWMNGMPICSGHANVLCAKFVRKISGGQSVKLSEEEKQTWDEMPSDRVGSDEVF